MLNRLERGELYPKKIPARIQLESSQDPRNTFFQDIYFSPL